ncbi:hypothetical protein WA026_000194, partial [Henosepilachna vigintioctopunctata]
PPGVNQPLEHYGKLITQQFSISNLPNFTGSTCGYPAMYVIRISVIVSQTDPLILGRNLWSRVGLSGNGNNGLEVDGGGNLATVKILRCLHSNCRVGELTELMS